MAKIQVPKKKRPLRLVFTVCTLVLVGVVVLFKIQNDSATTMDLAVAKSLGLTNTHQTNNNNTDATKLLPALPSPPDESQPQQQQKRQQDKGYKPVSTALDVNMTEQDHVYEKEQPIKFVIGLMFTDKEKYLDAVEAERDTWLQQFPNRRIFLVGSDPPRRRNLPRFVQSPCPDREVWCKRIEHISESYRMLTEDKIDFDWVLSGNEDWYVNIPKVLEWLKKRKPRKEAIIYTGIGCAQWWKYHKNSMNGTKPKPRGFFDAESCETLKQRGGVCGGCGIVFSRRSIEIMGEGGHDELFARTRREPFHWETHPLGDPVLSCLVYSYNDLITFKSLPWPFATGLPKNHHIGMIHARVGLDGVSPNLGMTPADLVRKSHEIITRRKGK